MFRRIMVPVDLTNRNIPALQITTKLALQNRASITLLHVIETLEGSSFEEFNKFYKTLEKHARDKLEGLAEECVSQGVVVHQEVLYGKRAEQIVQFAMDHQIDLIVLTSHKIDLKNPSQGWGSISYKVGILSQCPVLLVK
jgi:nucleotide-binding universal stress UspA family protein